MSLDLKAGHIAKMSLQRVVSRPTLWRCWKSCSRSLVVVRFEEPETKMNFISFSNLILIESDDYINITDFLAWKERIICNVLWWRLISSWKNLTEMIILTWKCIVTFIPTCYFVVNIMLFFSHDHENLILS
jgi:hypothetical protein